MPPATVRAPVRVSVASVVPEAVRVVILAVFEPDRVP